MFRSDEEILGLSREDDRDGLKAAFDKYYTALCLSAARITGDMQSAEDVVQSLFIRCWQDQCFLSIRGSLRSFLFTSVRNASINHVKQNRQTDIKDLESMEEPVEEHAPEEVPSPEQLEAMNQAILQLPDRCREVFQLVVVKQYSYKGAAEKLDLSVNTIKTQLSRAFRKLRDQLADQFPR